MHPTRWSWRTRRSARGGRNNNSSCGDRRVFVNQPGRALPSTDLTRDEGGGYLHRAAMNLRAMVTQLLEADEDETGG